MCQTPLPRGQARPSNPPPQVSHPQPPPPHYPPTPPPARRPSHHHPHHYHSTKMSLLNLKMMTPHHLRRSNNLTQGSRLRQPLINCYRNGRQRMQKTRGRIFKRKSLPQPPKLGSKMGQPPMPNSQLRGRTSSPKTKTLRDGKMLGVESREMGSRIIGILGDGCFWATSRRSRARTTFGREIGQIGQGR